MMRRETALSGLLLVAGSACSIDNPTFVLLTEATTTATTDAPGTVTGTDPTTTTQTSDASTAEPLTITDATGTTGHTSETTTTGVTGMTGSETTDASSDATSDGTTGDTTTDGTTGDQPGLDLPDCDAGDASLLACYDFDYAKGVEPTGLVDGSAYDHDGLVNIAAVVPGIEGTALKLLETTEINVASDDAFAYPAQAVTLSAWIFPTELPQGPEYLGILDKGPDYSFGLSGENGLSCRVGAGGFDTKQQSIGLKTWTHVACVFDVNEFSLYINGKLVETTSFNDLELASSNAPLLIGCGDPGCGAPTRFIGALDAMRIWNVALEPAAICGLAGDLNC